MEEVKKMREDSRCCPGIFPGIMWDRLWRNLFVNGPVWQKGSSGFRMSLTHGTGKWRKCGRKHLPDKNELENQNWENI